MNLTQLEPFCSKDETRLSIMSPFSDGVFTYATNGHFIVRVKGKLTGPKPEHPLKDLGWETLSSCRPGEGVIIGRSEFNDIKSRNCCSPCPMSECSECFHPMWALNTAWVLPDGSSLLCCTLDTLVLNLDGLELFPAFAKEKRFPFLCSIGDGFIMGHGNIPNGVDIVNT